MRTTCFARSCPALGDDRGAVLVHVAVALTGLLAFSALSIDMGVLWAARRQAQNAADSAAMAGAISLAYVDPTNQDYAADAARAVAAAHQIWGEAPVNPSVSVGPCPTGAPSSTGACVQVTLGRPASTATPLPIYMARLFGASPAAVEASGSAKVMIGNSSSCLRPWAIPDRWNDNRDVTGPIDSILTAEDLFERYDTPDELGYPGPLLPEPRDEYVAPGPGGPGTGYNFSHVGEHVVIDFGPYPAAALASASYFPIDLPRSAPIADAQENFALNITSCNGLAVSTNSTVMTNLDIHPQYTEQGIQALIDADPGAYWDGTRVVGSAFTMSPRIVAIPVFDPDQFRQTQRTAQRIPLVVRNIIGLFIERWDERNLNGTIVVLPGQYNDAAGQLTENSSFLRAVALVR